MATPEMPPRSVAVTIHLDANRINSRETLEHVNQLERWAEDGVIVLEMARPAYEEAKAGNDSRRRRKALNHIFTLTYADTSRERIAVRDRNARLIAEETGQPLPDWVGSD